MVSGPRCPPGLWGLLALLLPLPGARGTCDSPPRLHFAELPGVVNNSYPVGTKLKYSCRPGYILSSGKSPFVTCLENSKWSVEAEFCEGRRCKPLELENGRSDITDLRFGARANFSCDEGYRLIGPTSAQCVIVGNGVDWDTEVPLCQAIPCRPPPDITQGSHNGQSGEEFSFGSAVTYKCDPGLSLIGEASIHCTTKDHFNGEWSGPAPECKGLNTGTVIAIGPLSPARRRAGDAPRRGGNPLRTRLLRGPASLPARLGGWSSRHPRRCRFPRREGGGQRLFLSRRPRKDPPPRPGPSPGAGAAAGRYLLPAPGGPLHSLLPRRAGGCAALRSCSAFWAASLRFWLPPPGVQSAEKSCGHPGEPENGRVIVTDIHFGSTVNFTCEEGAMQRRGSLANFPSISKDKPSSESRLS
ncbi:complement receptor type 2-like [Eretmochelys imbricata]